MVPRVAKQKKLTAFNIRVTEDMRADLEAIAQEEKRSLSNLVVLVLEHFLDARKRREQN